MQRSQARLKNGPFSVLWSAFHRWEGCWKTCGRKALRAGAHAEGSARGQNGLHGRSGGLAGSSKTERRTGLVRDERPGGQGEPFRGHGEGELFQGAAGLVFSRNTEAGGGKNDIAASSSGRAASPSSQAHRNSARYSLSSRAKRAHERPARPLRGRASPQPFKAPGSVVKRRVKFKATGRVSSVTGESVDWDSLVGVESECLPDFEWNSKLGSRVFPRPETARRGKEAFLQFTDRRGSVQANSGASRFFFEISREMVFRLPMVNECRGGGNRENQVDSRDEGSSTIQQACATQR